MEWILQHRCLDQLMYIELSNSEPDVGDFGCYERGSLQLRLI